MQRYYNFSAGPAMLPLAVLEQIQAELLNWRDTGASVMELSHRSKPFFEMAKASKQLMRKLLQIPDNYHILFLPDGATMQFSGVAMNLLQPGKKAAYITTGIWSKKAAEYASAYGDIEIIATDEEQDGLSCVPNVSNIKDDYAYVYYTSNETINGLQFLNPPLETDIPLVCDMTSSFMSEPLDISRYGVIFASAQKNLGQAGITVVIVRDDLIENAQAITPPVFNYGKQVANDSMLNTPPTFAWYVCYLMLQWIETQGGVAAMQQQIEAKATLVYDCIDANPLYQGFAHPNSRSRLNMPFHLSEPKLEPIFLAEAERQGLIYLQGHRLMGGIRPSIYVGMPMVGVDVLVDFMNAFAKTYG